VKSQLNTLMMEGVRISETSVIFNVTTRRYIPEDSKLHTRRRKNVKSQLNTLMMEAVRTSETSVIFNVTTRRYIPEDSKLHTRRRENLKSNKLINLYLIFVIVGLYEDDFRGNEGCKHL
jgi:hypothetical protein